MTILRAKHSWFLTKISLQRYNKNIITEEGCAIQRNERLDEILEILQVAHYATVAQLAEKLYTSPSSIRRDLAILEKRRQIKRVHGGAKISHSNNLDIPFSYRLKTNVDKKRAIAKKAVQLVSPGDVVFVDSSTTGLYLVHELAKLSGITVVTNGIYAAQYLSDYDLSVICTGGRLDSSERTSMVGSEARSVIQSIYADFAFITPQAIDDKGILYDCYQDVTAICRHMLDNAAKKVVLCDSQKIGKVSTFKECTLEDVDICISDISLDSRYRRRFPWVQFL